MSVCAHLVAVLTHVSGQYRVAASFRLPVFSTMFESVGVGGAVHSLHLADRLRLTSESMRVVQKLTRLLSAESRLAYSIISSAVDNSEDGTVRPRALAV